MARVVCIAGSQPAFGKTTTAVNLAMLLAMADQQTLLVDWNPRSDATRQLRIPGGRPHAWSHPVHGPGRSVLEVTEHLQILTGNWESTAVAGIRDWPAEDCQRNGRRWAAELTGYDVVLIDCPPDAGSFTESALWAADEVLLPLRCEPSALQHVPEVIQTIRRVHAAPGKSLDFAGVLLTQVDATDPLAEPVEAEIRDFFGEIVFETTIPRDQAVAEAAWRDQPLVTWAPRSPAAWAYVELCMEVLGR